MIHSSLSNIKVIFFDHDDTLVQTHSVKWAEHKFIAKKYYDKVLADEELEKHWGKPLSTLFGLLYETTDIKQAMIYNKLHHAEYPKMIQKDTLFTLRTLRSRAIKVGVVTATNKFSFDYDLESLSIPREVFDYIQTEEDTIHHKPDPRVFDTAKLWLTENAIKLSECLYVGDGMHDMKAAQGAGLHFIGITTGLTKRHHFLESGVDTVKSLSELLEF